MLDREPLAPVVTWTAVAVHPVGVPVVTFGPEVATAAFAFAPCVMIAPPPTSFGVPAGHVTVEAGVTSPLTEFPRTVCERPATTVVLAIVPVAPFARGARVGPVAPAAPVAPVSPFGPVAPAGPAGPAGPVAPAG